MDTFKKIYPYLKNKYLLTILFMIVWLLFFDRNDVFSQYELRQQLMQLEQDKVYYMQEIEKNTQSMKELKTNPENLEKFAREKYLMKKDNEDIFLIVEEGK